MRHRTLFALIVLFAVVAAAILWHAKAPVPDRWNPLAPLHLADAPNFLTPFKLRHLRDEPARCHALLVEADIDFTPVPDRKVENGCGFRNAVRIDDAETLYGTSFLTSCPLAVGLALFERHTLQPAAQATFGTPVTRIEHYGSYACRNVNSRTGGPRSEHATANAMDVKAFRLRDGRRVTVGEWNDAGPERVFLRRLRDGACTIFKGVLGPDHDDLHADHFHLDMGTHGYCD